MLSPATGLEGKLCTGNFGNSVYRIGFAGQADDHPSVAKSGQLDALVVLERIGTRLSFGRNDEIYGEGDEAQCWYKVISGTVRICKLLADGRRHIAEFCFSGDCFGVDNANERIYAAEAVDDVIVMRFRRGPPSSWLIRTRSWRACCARQWCAISPPRMPACYCSAA